MNTIVHLVGSALVGGTEGQALMLLEESDPARFRSQVLLVRGGPREPDFRARAPTRVLGKRGPVDPTFALRLVSSLRHARADLLCAWGATASLWGPVAARMAGVPRTVTCQRSLGDRMGILERLVERSCARLVDVVTANSSAVAAATADRGTARSHIRVVPNGVRIPPLAGTPRERGLIVLVGRLDRDKGHDLLIEALPAVLQRVPEAHVVLVGDAVATSERVFARKLSARVHELGLTGHVRRLGSVDPGPWLARAGVVVAPSRSEGLPNALMEAMAAAAPTVACRVGGVPELVEDGVNGRLVAPGCPAALAQAVVATLCDAAAADALGRAARARMKAEFSPTAMADSWARVFDEALVGAA